MVLQSEDYLYIGVGGEKRRFSEFSALLRISQQFLGRVGIKARSLLQNYAAYFKLGCQE